MRARFLSGPALAALAIAICAARAFGAPSAPPTAAQAAAFIARAEADLSKDDDYMERVAWVQATYITPDTNWLYAEGSERSTALSVRYAKQAARYDHVKVDQVTRRKLELLKRGLVLPAPSRAGAGAQLADIEARLKAAYSSAKLGYRDHALTLDDMEDMLRTSREPDETRALWEGWRAVSAPPMKADYARLVTLANEGARELGYADTGVLWRSWYDMPPDAFGAKMDALWSQVEPLYRSLHCYVRARLHQRYGEAVQPASGPIRADLLGNMWSQIWGDIYDIVAPASQSLGYDLTASLVAHGYDALKIVHTADEWYQSIGFAPLPATFWERSMLTRPRDRDVVCHASAWDVDSQQDLRIKACLTVTADDFYTAHHELGHNMYQRAYAAQSEIFRSGANDGFHEAVGDFAGLNAVTPEYLNRLGLIDQVPPPAVDIPYLLRMALDKVPILAFALIVDKWRWDVFAGRITPAQYNDAWWDLVARYQYLTPPGPRPADAFDPGAKYHIANNVPYARYFLAGILEFQFYRAACRLHGWQGPLNRCSIYGDKSVGDRFRAMLELGASKPWPQALEAFTGERDIDASAIEEYFAPLARWLDEQNAGQVCSR